MNEKDKAYFGIDAKPKFRLDDHGNMIPIQHEEPVFVPKAPTVMAMAPTLETIEEVRPFLYEALGGRVEELTEEILELIYTGDYRMAYDLHCEVNIDIEKDSRFSEVLTDIVDGVMRGNLMPDGRYFRLLYMVGGNFNVASIFGLKEFIKLVFDTYYENHYPKNGPGPLIKLKRLFETQVDLQTIEGLDDMDEE